MFVRDGDGMGMGMGLMFMRSPVGCGHRCSRGTCRRGIWSC
jgi:hypothetical protein